MKNILLLFLLTACSSKIKEGDRRLKNQEIPSFLKSYQSYNEVDFFQKIKKRKIFYEVKYLEQEKEVSLKFNQDGVLVEEERDIRFDSLTPEQQSRIKSYLDQNYPEAKIHEVEVRLNKKKEKFIDVEIRHNSSPTRYWELSFDHEGNFVKKKLENLDDIETLN